MVLGINCNFFVLIAKSLVIAKIYLFTLNYFYFWNVLDALCITIVAWKLFDGKLNAFIPLEKKKSRGRRRGA